jgi:hypothetical protein
MEEAHILGRVEEGRDPRTVAGEWGVHDDGGFVVGGISVVAQSGICPVRSSLEPQLLPRVSSPGPARAT